MKIAKIGYGHDGRGVGKTDDGYMYLVDDDVKTGDVLQPVATNWKSQKKFVTTGRVNHSYKETTVKGQQAKQEAQSYGDITRVYKAQEVGTAVPQTQKYSNIYLVQNENGVLLDVVKEQKQSYRTQLTRGANVSKYIQQNPQATFTKQAQQNLYTYQGYEKAKGEQ